MKLELSNEEMLPEQKKTSTAEMKEGDYLRQRMQIDDDDDEDKTSTGCLARRPHRTSGSSATSSSSSLDVPSAPHRQHYSTSDVPPSHSSATSIPSSSSHHSKLYEKILRIFHYHEEDHSGTGGAASGRKPRASKSSTATNRASSVPRRRYMRVVKDADAPPPECVGDNPNIICRYSQDYLRKHYERKRHATGGDSATSAAVLPYVTSGHTILKKSSTDPTCGVVASSASGSDVMKHATFSEVVTVVEPGDGATHKEILHDNSSFDMRDGSGSFAEDEIEAGSGSASSAHKDEFYLADDAENAPDEAVEAPFPPVFDSAVEDKPKVEKSVEKEREKNSAGFMSVFASTAVPTGSSGVGAEAGDRKSVV